MNILETMDFCKEQQIKGVLVSVDQAKAFDSVSHSFMEKVYKFFGFGERIQRWLKSIGTGRSTCILILKPGELSSTKGPPTRRQPLTTLVQFRSPGSPL